MWKRLAMVSASALLLLGCSDPSVATIELLRLQGTVTDAVTGNPIEGAQIILQWPAGAFGTGTEWADADAEGRYNLERDFGGEPFTCQGFGMTAQAETYHAEFVQPGEIQCVPEIQIFDFELAPESTAGEPARSGR